MKSTKDGSYSKSDVVVSEQLESEQPSVKEVGNDLPSAEFHLSHEQLMEENLDNAGGPLLRSRAPVSLEDDPPHDEELLSRELIVDDLVDSGFSPDAAAAFASSDPTALISIDQLPPELIEDTLQDLAFIKQNGYSMVDEFHAEEITGVMNYIIGTDSELANMSFEELSLIPEQVENLYEYIGYSHPNYSVQSGVSSANNGTIRRIYSRHDTADVLVIEESQNVINARAVQLAEFVNRKIGQQPAIFQIHKSDSGKTFASLNWTSKTHSYILYHVGNIDKASDELTAIANDINSANL